MLKYMLKRAIWVIVALALVSFIAFVTIELLPWGARPQPVYLPHYNPPLTEEEMQWAVDYVQRFALDKPFLLRYLAWGRSVVVDGDWGHSWEWQKPVSELIYERLWLTLAIAVPALLMGWMSSIPLGVALTRHKSTRCDNLCTFVCRVGRQVPPFLIAFVVMWVAMAVSDRNVGGLFSEEYILAVWSWVKVGDLLGHIWLPILVLFLSSAAHSTLVMRGAMLREMSRSYVDGARIRGVAEEELWKRYPLRVALGQFLSTERCAMARMLSSAILVAMVFSLQSAGPMMLRGLTSQDTYVGGAFVMLLVSVSVVGTALIDIARAIIDPRLRTTATRDSGGELA